MALALQPLSTTSIGSFPRPLWLATTERGHAHFRLEGAALAEAKDDATLMSLREQEELGLDIVTDGEQRRERFIYHAMQSWDGVDFANTATKTAFRGRTNYPQVVPRIIGPLRRRAPACVADVLFAKAHTDRPVKLAVPGPLTIADSTADQFYNDEAALAMDAAVALNAELRDLQAAGCDMLQIDEPAMTRYHDKVTAFAARALDRCLDGITVPTIVHLCYGYPGGPDLQHHIAYPRLLDALMGTRIGGVSVEFGRSTFDPAVLAPCRDRLILYGCVDPGAAPAPSVAQVKRRVAELLDRVAIDPRRVLLTPDCGLMTIGRELARAKVRVMVEAAQDLRRGL
jgi:5-methyltetrahydropteroyltriglutamate--homocysteine methyltransferase